MHLGYTEALAGDYERAAGRLDESVGLFNELGETTWTQVAYRYLGLLALLGGRIDEAESLLRTSLMEGREQAPQWEVAHWIEELAAVAAAKGETLRAAKLWGATDALFEKLGLATSKRTVRCVSCSETMYEDHRHDSRADAWAQGHAMTLEQASLMRSPVKRRPPDLPYYATLRFVTTIDLLPRQRSSRRRTHTPRNGVGLRGRQACSCPAAKRRGRRSPTLGEMRPEAGARPSTGGFCGRSVDGSTRHRPRARAT